MLAETARRCLTEAGDAAGPLASDSSALETTRYEQAERPDMKERDFVQVRQKIYWKYGCVPRTYTIPKSQGIMIR